MPFRFTFEIAGVKEFDRSFNRVEGTIADLRPVWDALEPVMFDIEKGQFDSEGSEGRSGGWKKLSSPYAEQKQKRYPGTKILERSGAMKAALTGRSQHTQVVKTADEFGFGTDLEYPIYHQKGTKKMPKREVVSLSDTGRRRIQKAIQKQLLVEIKKTGLTVED